jgi:putative glycosyltransferase
MRLSIVTTLYRSEAFIWEFYKRISLQAQNITSDYEILFVNDGSPDNSKEIVLAIQEKDPHVILVDLSKNFGHHKALLTIHFLVRDEQRQGSRGDLWYSN